MSELVLQTGSSEGRGSALASAVVDVERGGRLASLEVDGLQLLLAHPAAGSMQWGSYPMVPWAGRVRDGRFRFGGQTHQLPLNLPPHSAHGVGFTSAWTVVDDRTIELDLGPPWPFGGRATQRFDLDRDGLTITMTVEADVDMPAMIGWHPWFTRRLVRRDGATAEAELAFGPGRMYELDEVAIPTGTLVDPPPGPWDNCFTDLVADPVIDWPGLLGLRLSSSCDHWVVYTEPVDALCVEPQSAAPDDFNRSPTVVPAGGQLEAWFRLDWG